MNQKLITGLLALGILVVGFLAGHVFSSGKVLGASGAVFDGLPHWFGNALYVGASQQLSVDSSGNVTTTGTSTIQSSVTGTTLGGHYVVSATGTPVTLFTNNGTPRICDTDTGYLYVKSTGFSPTLKFSVATSTGLVPGTNIVASSTAATTTNGFFHPATGGGSFLLKTGDSFIAEAGDITNILASSTNYGNWSVD